MLKRFFLLFLVCTIFVILLIPAGAQVKVLMYHAHSSMGFSGPVFTDHMDFLEDNGYHTITVQQLYEWLTNAEPLPPHPILITFDDNYIPVYDVAYPILKARNQSAVNFAHTNYVGVITGSGDHCDWTEIQQMESDCAFYTESHTRTHPDLTTLSDSSAWSEINGSHIDIETNISAKTCISIAYPYGKYDSRIIGFCQTAGYSLGFTTIAGYNYRTTPPFELRRETVGSETIEQFKGKIGYPDLPPAPPGEGWTIDNTDPNFFIDSGSWTLSTSTPGYYGINYYAIAAGDGSAKVRWATYLPTAGTYRVYAWWSQESNRATNASYEIHHNPGISTVSVNQQINGGQWNVLGEFSFSTSEPAAVYLSNIADGYVIADGIWFEPVSTSGVLDWNIY